MVEPGQESSFPEKKNVENWIEAVSYSKLYEQNNQIVEYPFRKYIF